MGRTSSSHLVCSISCCSCGSTILGIDGASGRGNMMNRFAIKHRSCCSSCTPACLACLFRQAVIELVGRTSSSLKQSQEVSDEIERTSGHLAFEVDECAVQVMNRPHNRPPAPEAMSQNCVRTFSSVMNGSRYPAMQGNNCAGEREQESGQWMELPSFLGRK